MIQTYLAASTIESSPASLVMLRWIVPAGWPYESARELVDLLVSPAVRASGWLCSPGTTHHVEDRGTEVWLTVVARLDDVTDVRDDLTGFLKCPPTFEITHGVLLAPRARWYRRALQEVTGAALDLLEVGASPPLTEREAFADPSESVVLLMSLLSGLSDSYRQTCASYEKTERFWLGFFRRTPAPELPPAGHSLWNLAG